MKGGILTLLMMTLCLPVYAGWRKRTSMPVATSNNAVAVAGDHLYTFLGLGRKKSRQLPLHAWRYSFLNGRWSRLPEVPAGAHGGRLASTAQAVGKRVFLIGGYSLVGDNQEVTENDVNIFNIESGSWSRGANVPTPVDDAVSGVFLNRYIVLIGGWSQTNNVRKVQFYDTEKNFWFEGTSSPGPAVFGHAGGIYKDRIVYCDGVMNFMWTRNINRCFLGILSKEAVGQIAWTEILAHPGNPRFRMAAGPSKKYRGVVFTGGTDNPYNIDGVGYDGNPSRPIAESWVFNLERGEWMSISAQLEPSMDHRGLVEYGNSLFMVGGMDRHQNVLREFYELK